MHRRGRCRPSRPECPKVRLKSQEHSAERRKPASDSHPKPRPSEEEDIHPQARLRARPHARHLRGRPCAGRRAAYLERCLILRRLRFKRLVRFFFHCVHAHKKQMQRIP